MPLSPEDYQQQHKQRLAWMPWLYYRLKDKHLEWAKPWQQAIQQHIQAVETVTLAEHCFIAPDAQLFAEPGRLIDIAANSFVAAQCFLHGPLSIGEHVAINHGCSIDGGQKGVSIGKNSRIANGVKIYAFNHGMHPDQPIWQQNSQSQGINIGEDVWIGANVCITDGVNISNHAVVGMGSVVTKNVPEWAIVAGNPAKIIGDRRDKA
ncbi:acyltransferase [Agarivorans sp. Toyoura001]|uniref:acyltransferase n=1 Tax=unclassified Agarivorans TaxID=2636026 RepID=UPI0010E91869|nr:acyltransferase [Agarivorans sp. Toyoura001]GDY25706.1 acyltransferase [Agarivorans sp. Toyoura001]